MALRLRNRRCFLKVQKSWGPAQRRIQPPTKSRSNTEEYDRPALPTPMASASYCSEYGVSLVYALSTKSGILAGRGVIIFASLVFVLHHRVRLNCPGDVVSKQRERRITKENRICVVWTPRCRELVRTRKFTEPVEYQEQVEVEKML